MTEGMMSFEPGAWSYEFGLNGRRRGGRLGRSFLPTEYTEKSERGFNTEDAEDGGQRTEHGGWRTVDGRRRAVGKLCGGTVWALPACFLQLGVYAPNRDRLMQRLLSEPQTVTPVRLFAGAATTGKTVTQLNGIHFRFITT